MSALFPDQERILLSYACLSVVNSRYQCIGIEPGQYLTHLIQIQAGGCRKLSQNFKENPAFPVDTFRNPVYTNRKRYHNENKSYMIFLLQPIGLVLLVRSHHIFQTIFI